VLPRLLFPFPTETLSNRDLKKKMSPTNAKALNTMRQRVKKHNSSEEYGQLVQKYRWVHAVYHV
jgi:translation initiation factor 3 subunit C